MSQRRFIIIKYIPTKVNGLKKKKKLKTIIYRFEQ